MNKEKFLVKGVNRHFNGQEVLFEVESLHEHYEGLEIHDADITYAEKGELVVGYVRANDVNIDNAIEKEVFTKEVSVEQIEVIVTEETLEDNPELVDEGVLVGETITVDEVEPIVETPAPKKKKVTTEK